MKKSEVAMKFLKELQEDSMDYDDNIRSNLLITEDFTEELEYYVGITNTGKIVSCTCGNTNKKILENMKNELTRTLIL